MPGPALDQMEARSGPCFRISRIAIGRPIRTCSISGAVTPKRFPKSMCERKLIWLGTFDDMRTVPNANVVNTMPIVCIRAHNLALFDLLDQHHGNESKHKYSHQIESPSR